MSESAEQPDPEVFTLDHLFQGGPDVVVTGQVEAPDPVDDLPEDADPVLPAAP